MLSVDFKKLDQNSTQFLAQREAVFSALEEEICNVIGSEIIPAIPHQLLDSIKDIAKHSPTSEVFEYFGDGTGLNPEGQFTHVFNTQLKSNCHQAASFQVSLFEKPNPGGEYKLACSHTLRLSFQRKVGLWANHSVMIIPLIAFTHQFIWQKEENSLNNNELGIEKIVPSLNWVLFGVNADERIYCTGIVSNKRCLKVCINEFRFINRVEL